MTTGPGRTSTISPLTWKSSSTDSSRRALRSSAGLVDLPGRRRRWRLEQVDRRQLVIGEQFGLRFGPGLRRSRALGGIGDLGWRTVGRLGARPRPDTIEQVRRLGIVACRHDRLDDAIALGRRQLEARRPALFQPQRAPREPKAHPDEQQDRRKANQRRGGIARALKQRIDGAADDQRDNPAPAGGQRRAAVGRPELQAQPDEQDGDEGEGELAPNRVAASWPTAARR